MFWNEKLKIIINEYYICLQDNEEVEGTPLVKTDSTSNGKNKSPKKMEPSSTPGYYSTNSNLDNTKLSCNSQDLVISNEPKMAVPDLDSSDHIQKWVYAVVLCCNRNVYIDKESTSVSTSCTCFVRSTILVMRNSSILLPLLSFNLKRNGLEASPNDLHIRNPNENIKQSNDDFVLLPENQINFFLLYYNSRSSTFLSLLIECLCSLVKYVHAHERFRLVLCFQGSRLS